MGTELDAAIFFTWFLMDLKKIKFGEAGKKQDNFIWYPKAERFKDILFVSVFVCFFLIGLYCKIYENK